MSVFHLLQELQKGGLSMLLPEQRAREIIDKQIKDAGWDIVSRDEFAIC